MTIDINSTKHNKVSNINFEDLIPYCIFPNSFIRNGKIPASQRILFEILCTYDFIDSKGNRKGWCDPGLERLSEEMGLGIRATQIHLKRLVESGMICIIYRNCCKTGKRTSIYVLNILPGLSIVDIKRIASTRNLEIKNTLSGLNDITIQTVNGMEYISREEFDLQYILTGNRSDNIMEGEVGSAEDIISDEEEAKVYDTENIIKDNKSSNRTVNKDKEIPIDESIVDSEISFGKPKNPINLNAHIERQNKMNSENWNNTNPINRINCGNFKDIKPIDYCKYFKFQYENTYEGECLIVDRTKDLSAIKLRLVDMEPEDLVSIMNYFIGNYQRLFYSADYKRPQIYQLSIPWIMNKLLENYYYSKKAENEFGSIKVQTNINEVKETITQLF